MSMFIELRSLRAFAGMLALLAALPRVGQAGLYTSPTGPTYNVGPEAAFMNPAGMTGLKSAAVTLGVGGVIPLAEWETTVAGAGGSDGGNSGVATVIPTFYVVGPVTDRFSLGLSVTSPVGGPNGLGWGFPDDFAGRYGSLGVTFATTAVGPSAAFKVTDKWSVGAGGVAQWLEVNLAAAINTPFPGDGRAEFNDLNDWSARWFVGTQYQLSPTTSFGLVYRSEWESDVEGEFRSVIPVTPTAVVVPSIERTRLDLILPRQVEFGLQHALSKTWILGMTFDWENWSRFAGIGVNFRFENGKVVSAVDDINWRDTYSGGISLTHIMGPNILNFGLNYASSPVSDENRIILLPVDHTLTLSVGFARNASKALTYSFGAAGVFSGGAPVSQMTQGAQFTGRFKTNVAVVLGGSLQWRF